MPMNIRPRSDVSDYLDSLRGPSRPGGLIFGIRRPGPATPCPDVVAILQRLRGAVTGCLAGAGARVFCSPVDVVLDEKKALVLHPSAAIVLPNREGIVKGAERLWGPPNVVVELLWSATARHTRCSKVRWYRAFDVEECWLLDPKRRRVEVHDFRGVGRHVPFIYRGRRYIGSRLLRRCVRSQELFMDALVSSKRA
jgi:hypothetical protein